MAHKEVSAVVTTSKVVAARQIAKNARIAETYKETRERRRQQSCRVFELKLDRSRMNSQQKEALTRVFLEKKWARNAALASDKPTGYRIGGTVPVLTPWGIEERELRHLGSQIKQSIVAEISANIKALAAHKKGGRKVGGLRFSRECNTIDLKQFGTTYRLDVGRKALKIQKVPGEFRVHGAEQITADMELANARLVRRESGYYLLITTFTDKNLLEDHFTEGSAVGLDMGVATHLTLSNGEKISAMVEVPKRLKRLQRSLQRKRDAAKARQQPGQPLPLGSNYFKNRAELRKEYEKLDRKKANLANQIVARITANEHVFYQDEQLSAWKRRWGGKLHHSVLGRIKAKLGRHERAHMLDKWVPTTQRCPKCNALTKHDLRQRTYHCAECGYTADRDVNAANNMVDLGLSEFNVPVERRELTTVPITEDGYLRRLGCAVTHGERDTTPLFGGPSQKQ